MKIDQFLADVKLEVKKVDWPTKQRIIRLTLVVLLVVVVMTAFTFVLDIGLGNLLFK